jgi:hypothetical protein
VHVDLVAGDRLAAALDGRHDFGGEVLAGVLARAGPGGWGDVCLVVDDVGEGRGGEAEDRGELHGGCVVWGLCCGWELRGVAM